MEFNLTVVVFFCAIGFAECNQKVWDWWGCNYSCDSDKGWEGLAAYQGALLQEEQCAPWSSSGQGDFWGLQGFPPCSAWKAGLRLLA